MDEVKDMGLGGMIRQRAAHLPEGMRIFPGAGAILGTIDAFVNLSHANSI